MKVLLILALLTVTASAQTSRKPIVKDGMVSRTIQQDAELKHWITGLQAENQRNEERAALALKSEENVRLALTEASKHATTLQGQIDTLAKDRDAQTERAKKAEASLEKMREARDFWRKIVVGVGGGLFALAAGYVIIRALKG